jgi:hypothetical protein
MWYSIRNFAKAARVRSGVCATIVFLLTTASIHSLARGQSKSATIELKPVYAGEEFSFPLSDFTRGGFGKKTFILSGNVPGLKVVEELAKNPDGIPLKNPDGTPAKNPDGSPRTVFLLKGVPDTPKDSPYEFAVDVTDSNGNKVSLQFSLPVLPFGANFDSARDLIAQIRPPKLATCSPTANPFVMVSSTADEETVALTQILDPSYTNYLDPSTIKITDVDRMIRETLKTDGHADFRKGDYVVVHIIKWKALKEEKSDPEKELWALYEKVDQATEWVPHLDPKDTEKNTFDNRIFGSRRVFALAIHLNTPAKWDIKYKVTINQKTPQPIANLMQLAAGILGGGGAEAKCVEPPVKNIWGARLMLFKYLASDMIVKVNTITSDASGQQVEQSKEYTKEYDNEGRYYWDVSVGMPVKSIKELEFTVESNGSSTVVSTKKKERQNAYAFLNLFPKAVDLKGDSFLTSFHFLLGVPITGKPLDRPMIGVGTGIYKDMLKLNLFAGLVFNRVREPKTLQVGDNSTPFQLENDLRSRRVTKFIFGVNFPIRQILSSIRAKK